MRNTLLLMVVAAVAAGCNPATRKPKSAAGGKAGAAAGAGGAEAAPLPPGAEAEEASLRGGGFELVGELKTVRFEYDSAQLSEETRAVLKDNAAVLKRRGNLEFLVAGHTDERGTVAYNLALGQKRAKEVRDYYIRLGVDGRRLATVSFGKEQPECSESNEECWGRNRRAETRARLKSQASNKK